MHLPSKLPSLEHALWQPKHAKTHGGHRHSQSNRKTTAHGAATPSGAEARARTVLTE